MGEDLDRFIEEQKAKLAQDKAELERDLPLMESRSSIAQPFPEADTQMLSMSKENIPPNIQNKGRAKQMNRHFEEDCGLSLPLGEEYERKKHKLKQELRQDYRRYLSQNHVRMTGEVDPDTQGLSLPIWERLSAKERLRNERNKEYNQFLREKDNANGKYRLVAIQNLHNDQQIKPQLKQESYVHRQISQRGHPLKKDAYTSMEAYEELLNRKRHEEGRYRRLGNEVEVRNGRQHRISDEEPEMITRPHQRYDDDEVENVARPRKLPVEASLNPSYPTFHLDRDPSEDSSPRHRHERDSSERVPQILYHPPERFMWYDDSYS